MKQYGFKVWVILAGLTWLLLINVMSAQQPIEILAPYPNVIPVEVRQGVYQNFCFDNCHVLLPLNGVEFMEIEYSTFNNAFCGWSQWFFAQDLDTYLLNPPTQPVNIVGCD